jgi:hypothetical protein
MPIYHAAYATNMAQLNPYANAAVQQQHHLATAASLNPAQPGATNPAAASALSYQPINFPLQYGQIISLPCN